MSLPPHFLAYFFCLQKRDFSSSDGFLSILMREKTLWSVTAGVPCPQTGISSKPCHFHCFFIIFDSPGHRLSQISQKITKFSQTRHPSVTIQMCLAFSLNFWQSSHETCNVTKITFNNTETDIFHRIFTIFHRILGEAGTMRRAVISSLPLPSSL